MSRALIVITRKQDRERVARWAQQAPPGTRVTFKETKRSIPQNDKFWALLSDIAAQKEHMGRKYPADIWKLLFLDAFGRETKFVPALDGSTVVPIGQSSSDLSKAEMSELIQFIEAWASENGVILHDSIPPSHLSREREVA